MVEKKSEGENTELSTKIKKQGVDSAGGEELSEIYFSQTFFLDILKYLELTKNRYYGLSQAKEPVLTSFR